MDNRWNKLLKGDFQLPTWAAVFILIAGLVALGGYHGFKKYNSYQAREAEKEKITETLLLTQQQELEKTRQEIETLKSEGGDRTNAQDVLVSQVSQLEGRLASVVNEWRSRVASIECRWEGSLDEETSHGSGLWISSDSIIITSDHVVKEEDVFIGPPVKANSCSIKLPGEKAVTAKGSDISSWQGVEEVAAIAIKNPTPGMKRITSSLNSVCKSAARAGERVVILGYPAIGVKGDVTVTEGIISGYEDNFYITSAKIERGVSGGVAVLVDKSCYLGIPTFVRAGEVESLGRILDSRLLIK